MRAVDAASSTLREKRTTSPSRRRDLDASMDTDQELLASYRQGNVESLEQLINGYRRKMLALARTLLGCDQAADHAVRKTEETIRATANSIVEHERPVAWIARVAVAAAKDIRTQRASQPYTSDSLNENPQWDLSSRHQSPENLKVLSAFQKLTEIQRLSLNLRYHMGLRYSEIAIILDQDESEVQQILQQALSFVSGNS